jgi:hypothetical protein
MTPHADQLEQLCAQLALAVKECERYRLSPGQVRNCPSDLQNLDAAWRKRQNLEFQINQLEKSNALRLYEHAR